MNTVRQRGDTIVEVLICIAIVGTVLAGAFVVTNRSQLGVRDSQEHAEASKLVESQLEQLRASARVTGTQVFTYNPTGGFCMVNAAPVAATDSRCTMDSAGAASGAANAYAVTIRREANPSGVGINGGRNGWVFDIQARWASVGGSGQAQESMKYRLYP